MSARPAIEPVPSVEAALAKGDVPALQALSTAADKLVSKAAKRALHRLRARGVAIPEPTAEIATASPSRSAAPAEDSREPVLATAVDGSGERAIFLPLKASRGFELHLAVLSDEKGVLSLTSRQLSRRQLHAFVAELSPDTREMLREIPLERARALLTAAVELNPGGAMGTAEAAGIPELLRALPHAEKQESAELESASSTDASAALRDSLALFEAPALRSYVPPQDVVLAVGQKLEEVMLSPLLVDETQRLAQMRHALERAATEYFTSQRRSLYAARLRDAAEHFLDRGDSVNADRARAVAAALASDRPIEEIPFARGMFERIFDLEAAAKAPRPRAG